MGLSGYGVDLAVKNTEYKVTDDRRFEENDDAGEAGGGSDGNDFDDEELDSDVPSILAISKDDVNRTFLLFIV